MQYVDFPCNLKILTYLCRSSIFCINSSWMTEVEILIFREPSHLFVLCLIQSSIWVLGLYSLYCIFFPPSHYVMGESYLSFLFSIYCAFHPLPLVACCRVPVLTLFSSYGLMTWSLCFYTVSWQHGIRFTAWWGGKRWWITGKRSCLSENYCCCKSICMCYKRWIILLSSSNVRIYSKTVKKKKVEQHEVFIRGAPFLKHKIEQRFCWTDLWNAQSRLLFIFFWCLRVTEWKKFISLLYSLLSSSFAGIYCLHYLVWFILSNFSPMVLFLL